MFMKRALKIIGVTFSMIFILGVYWVNTNLSRGLSYKELSLYAYKTLELPDGFHANYNVQGNPDGQTILLVHGGGDSQGTWQPWIDILGDTYQFITVDLPGHGLTDPLPYSDYNSENFGKFLRSFIDELGLHDFIIGGHSFGGESVLHYMTRNPGKAKGLILVSSGGYKPNAEQVGSEQELVSLADSWLGKKILPYYGKREFTEEALTDYFYNTSVIDSSLVDRMFDLSRYEKNRGGPLFLVVNASKNYKHVNGIETIKVPTLILWGEFDHVVNTGLAKRFDKDIKDSKLIIYNNIGHVPQNENAQQSAKDVDSFIRENFINKTNKN